MPTASTRHQYGLSLVELVVFILVVGIAFTAIMSVYIQTGARSGDAMLRLRTTELAQSLMEEILLKKYDERTPQSGNCVRFPSGNSRCSGGPQALAQTAAGFGSDSGETRPIFDDVDDYHNIAYCGTGAAAINPPCTSACTDLLDASGNNIAANYPGFSVCIQVSFSGNEMNSVAPGTGTTVLNEDAKRIDIHITDPLDSQITFSAYRANY